MGTKDIQVTKRNGKVERFDADKINKVLQWSVDGIKDVSFEEVAMNAHLQFYNGITSKDIHLMLVEAAANLISETKSNYQYVASRLLNYQLRKEVWGGKNPPKFFDFVKKNVEISRVYDPEILVWYTTREFEKLDEFIKHDRDFNFTYAGIKQLCEKYLVQHRGTKEIYETPQFAYMLMAMTLFRDYGDRRTEYVKRAYTFFSRHKINLPTPIMAGVRTNIRSYASCALFSISDDLKSIFANNSAVGLATASRYGIGINPSRIRATNAPIRDGDTIHTGVVSFLKMYEATVKSCQQGGLRGGGATTNFAYFHYDIEDIIVLKNNAKSDDKSVRKLDYCISLDKLFYERFIKNENITLFSSHEVPELWDNFGLPSFRELYEKAERKHLKFKKVVKARDLMMLLSKERIETGRIYILNIDHVNDHGSWNEQVDMANLCVAPESTILTKNGYKVISTLLNQEVQVWNGKEWSSTIIRQTGIKQPLMKIVLEDGRSLDCTPYHKLYPCFHQTISKDTDDVRINFYEKEVKASELKVGDTLQIVDKNFSLTTLEYHNRTYSKICWIGDVGRIDDTYCCNESKEHKIVINGILTGNCVEVTQPTIPIRDLNDTNGEIGVCILAAVNLLEIKDKEEMESVADITVRMLDSLIDHQKYFVPAAENFAKKRRSLGVGITNLAALLAREEVKYSSVKAPNIAARYMEQLSYYLIKASVELAKEKGPCEKFSFTKYSKGILPIDTYKKDIDEFVTEKLHMDWESLRQDIKKYGMRHSTLCANMPVESSSLIQSSTNGMEPPRSLISNKRSKAGVIPVVVPMIESLAKNYTLAFDMPDNEGYLRVVAALQKFVDMSTSTNLYYNVNHYADKQIPQEELIKDIMLAYRWGIKSLYYSNTYDGDTQSAIGDKVTSEQDCASGACAI